MTGTFHLQDFLFDVLASNEHVTLTLFQRSTRGSDLRFYGYMLAERSARRTCRARLRADESATMLMTLPRAVRRRAIARSRGTAAAGSERGTQMGCALPALLRHACSIARGPARVVHSSFGYCERGFCLLKGIAEGTYNSKHAEAARLYYTTTTTTTTIHIYTHTHLLDFKLEHAHERRCGPNH